MLIDECTLPKSNTLVSDYLSGEKKALAYFDYDYKEMQTYLDRRHELSDQPFPREALAAHLHQFNRRYSTHPKVFENIQKLRQPDCTVVIAGQQAGFLTGPLYTIYKAISAIRHAERLEKKLHTPVIPVFWVAGEDHDYQEINHIWLLKNNQMAKEIYPSRQNGKYPVSSIEIEKNKMKHWIKHVFALFGETEHSQEMLQFLYDKLEHSQTATDFFISIMASFFEKYGLVFVDSAHEQLRKMESPFFKKLVQQNDALRMLFQEQRKRIVNDGYPSGVDAEAECAHLFYHIDGERHLLFYKNLEMYTVKDGGLELSKAELEAVCDEQPERLSNNVVTRPLMQEYLFPTLAFVAGPGEITYWAQLKPLFAHFGKKMPPIVPRMHVTLVERQINKWLKTFNLSLQSVFTNGVREYREQWLEQNKDGHADSVLQETRHIIDLAHANLRKYAWEADHNLGQISEKNRQLIMKQLDYMERRIQMAHENRYARELAKFAQIEAKLIPNGSLQERVWNIFYFLNQYGFEFFEQLFLDYSPVESKHYLVFL